MSELAGLLVLLVLSGAFSGSETALVALSRARVEALLREGRAGAVALYELKKDPSRMLTTILIGNNLVNIGASAMATVIATREFGHAGPGIAVGLLTLFILVFGEITPKSLATRYPERISLVVAMPLLLFMRLMYPLVWMFGQFTAWVHRLSGGVNEPTVTESELIGMLGHGVAEGEIHRNEREIIERVFEFNDLKVRDVMTPKGKIFSLDGKLTVAAALPLVTVEPYSRIPLFIDHPDNIVKILYMRDLMTAIAHDRLEVPLEEIGHKPLFVSQYQAIDALFAMLRRRNRHFSIVVDEYGDVRGIVTLEDLIEEIVGEVRAPLGLAAGERRVLEDHRRTHMVHAWQQHGAERLAVRHHAADGHAAEVDAVIAAFTPDEAHLRGVALGAVIRERHLERGLHGLRAGVREEDVVEAFGRDVHEARGRFECFDVPHHERAGEVERLGLFLDRGDDLRPAVAGIDTPQSRRAVDHAPAIGREIVDSLGAGEEPRRLLELPVGRERHPEGFEIVGLELHVHDVDP